MILEGNIDGFLKGSIETIGKNPVINELNVSENGIYMPDPGVDGFAPVNVNVPIPTFSTDELNAIANGEYTPPSGVDGFSKVIVNVPKTPLNNLTVTENGTYTAPTDTGYDEVNVNVPLPSNAYLLKEIEDVDIASFSDGSNLPMPSLKVGIEPIQEGSGDPSPTNIRPISGWDECNVNRAKVYQICEPSDSTEITANGVTMTYLGKGKYRVKGTLTTNEYTSLNLPIVPFTIYGGDDCYIKLNNSVGLSAVSIIFKNNTSQVDSWGLYPSNRSGSYVGMRNKYTNNIAIDISSSGYGTNFDFTFKVEILSNSTANLSTYNISFGSAGTVYGGTLDVVSGDLKVVPYYASYNGETLEGEWISDRDVYAVGTTPTIGAQVVNIGATPQVIQLTPTLIETLPGNNVITADTGSINNIEYFAK